MVRAFTLEHLHGFAVGAFGLCALSPQPTRKCPGMRVHSHMAGRARIGLAPIRRTSWPVGINNSDSRLSGYWNAQIRVFDPHENAVSVPAQRRASPPAQVDAWEAEASWAE